MAKLMFYFPSEGPGGVQSIILRIIEYSHSNNLDVVFVQDCENNYISSEIKNVNFEAYKKHVISLYEIESLKGYTFICFNWQLTFAYDLQKKYGINFLYWDVHSTVFEKLFNLRLFGRDLINQDHNSSLSDMVSEGRVVTIDLVSKSYIEESCNPQHYDKISVSGIPLGGGKAASDFFEPRIVDDIINIVYIGRAVDWKVIPFSFALEKIMKKYASYKLNCKIYTDNIECFRSFFKFQCNDKCTIEYVEGASISDIINAERGRVNMAVGMGTSQFELLSYGVPTLLIPAVTDIDVLEKFDPIWTHLLPNYIYGFDSTSQKSFEKLALPQNISLSDSNFSWNTQQLATVRRKSLEIADLYSLKYCLEVLVNVSSNLSGKGSRVWKRKEFIGLYLWGKAVGLLKGLVK